MLQEISGPEEVLPDNKFALLGARRTFAGLALHPEAADLEGSFFRCLTEYARAYEISQRNSKEEIKRKFEASEERLRQLLSLMQDAFRVMVAQLNYMPPSAKAVLEKNEDVAALYDFVMKAQGTVSQSHDHCHVKDVFTYAIWMANEILAGLPDVEANLRLVAIGALVHDLAYPDPALGRKKHGTVEAADYVERRLREFNASFPGQGLSEQEIEIAKLCVAMHSLGDQPELYEEKLQAIDELAGTKGKVARTIVRIVTMADKAAALGIPGGARSAQYGVQTGRPLERQEIEDPERPSFEEYVTRTLLGFPTLVEDRWEEYGPVAHIFERLKIEMSEFIEQMKSEQKISEDAIAAMEHAHPGSHARLLKLRNILEHKLGRRIVNREEVHEKVPEIWDRLNEFFLDSINGKMEFRPDILRAAREELDDNGIRDRLLKTWESSSNINHLLHPWRVVVLSLEQAVVNNKMAEADPRFLEVTDFFPLACAALFHNFFKPEHGLVSEEADVGEAMVEIQELLLEAGLNAMEIRQATRLIDLKNQPRSRSLQRQSGRLLAGQEGRSELSGLGEHLLDVNNDQEELLVEILKCGEVLSKDYGFHGLSRIIYEAGGDGTDIVTTFFRAMSTVQEDMAGLRSLELASAQRVATELLEYTWKVFNAYLMFWTKTLSPERAMGAINT
ncbi:MAG: HD domain-containing protein [bacterium]